jgi:hypothetical protein
MRDLLLNAIGTNHPRDLEKPETLKKFYITNDLSIPIIVFLLQPGTGAQSIFTAIAPLASRDGLTTPAIGTNVKVTYAATGGLIGYYSYEKFFTTGGALSDGYTINNTLLQRPGLPDVQEVLARSTQMLIPDPTPPTVVGISVDQGAACATVREQWFEPAPSSFSAAPHQVVQTTSTVVSGVVSSQSSEKTTSGSASASASAGWGPFSASLSASLSMSSTSSQALALNSEQTSTVFTNYENKQSQSVAIIHWQPKERITGYALPPVFASKATDGTTLQKELADFSARFADWIQRSVKGDLLLFYYEVARLPIIPIQYNVVISAGKLSLQLPPATSPS